MLINCVAYRDGLKLRDLSLDQVSEALLDREVFVWVALKDATEDELQAVQHEFDLHPLAMEDARSGHQRPKLEEYNGTLFCAVHLLEREDDEIRVGEVDIFVGPNFVVSIRSHSQQNFLGVRARCETEPELLRHGPGFVFYAILDTVVDRYFGLIDHLETELEQVEAQIFESEPGRALIQRLYYLKRKALTVRHAAVPMLDFLSKLFGGRVPLVCQNTQEYFRDVHDHLSRIVAALDTIREAVSTAIQVNLSLVTIEDSGVTKKLAAWAAIFAVPTAFAGIWGMNFDYMPEIHWVWGYPMALTCIGLISFVFYRHFKRSGWI